MIMARGETQNGRPVLLLGFSFAYLDAMRAGKGIQFDGTPYGYPGQIYIFAGETEAAMARLIVDANPDVRINKEKDVP